MHQVAPDKSPANDGLVCNARFSSSAAERGREILLLRMNGQFTIFSQIPDNPGNPVA